MTCWEKHRIACKILLGDPCIKIHEGMDRVIGGKDHREHTHDLLGISAIIYEKYLYLTPEEKLKLLKAGIIHLVQDKGKDCISDIEESLTKALRNEFIVPPGIQSNWFKELKDFVFEIFGNITVHKGGSLKVLVENGEGRRHEFSNVDGVVMYDEGEGKLGEVKDGRFVKIQPDGQTFEILHSTYKYQDYDMQERVIREFEGYKGLLDKFLPLINACNSCQKRESCSFR